MFKEKISVQELGEMSLKCFEGEIILVDTIEMVRMATRYLNQFDVLGFDTESKPIFRKGEIRRIAILQLSTNHKAFIFKMQKIGLPEELVRIFTNPEISKVGVAIRDDIKGLQKMSPFSPEGFIELQDTAQAAGIQNLSLKKLCAIVCGFRISKSQQTSNWESGELSGSQLVYAATDAWVSLLIYQQLINHR